MNKDEFARLIKPYDESIQRKPRTTIRYLGDGAGNIVVSGQPDLVWVRDAAGNLERVKRGDISVNPDNEGLPLLVSGAADYSANYPEVSRPFTEQISGYTGASYRTAFVGTPEAIAYADSEGNLTSDFTHFRYSGAQLLLLNDSIGAAIEFYLYSDTVGNNPFLAGHRAGGTLASPTKVLSGMRLVRVSAQGYGDTGFEGTTTSVAMDYTASQDHSDTAHGTQIDFNVTANGTLGATKFNAVSINNDGLLAMKRGGAILRTLPTGYSVTIPDGYSEVVSGYYTLAGTASVTLAGDAELRVI